MLTATRIVIPTITPISGSLELWEDATETTIGQTSEWTNKVELADINGDGWVDILFANGGNYDLAGEPTFSQVFLNQGADEMFKEVTQEVFGNNEMLARVIKVRDINGDTYPDIMVGTTFQTQSRLFLNDGLGNFTEVTQTHLPQFNASVGDLEFGDVDNDGDLDMILAHWGGGSPMQNEGGRTMLWLNDGTGHFSDVTDVQMPDILVKFSWELEFVDIENDYDLDILVSCKMCTGSYLFENDGLGFFVDITQDHLPQFSNNYDFEAMDINNDGYLDLITINDGMIRRERIFLNNQLGGFEEATSEFLPNTENLMGKDDNMAVYLDFDSDGDADILIGSLTEPDRLLINDGLGHLSVADNVFIGMKTYGTLGLAVADLNGDDRLDVVQAQGEILSSSDERVFLGKNIQPDSAPPIISLIEDNLDSETIQLLIRARIHDNKSPTMPHDWQSVMLHWTVDGQTLERPMEWYGEYLWRATIDEIPEGDFNYQVCATDQAGNQTCSSP
jgi:hypothetical protein